MYAPPLHQSVSEYPCLPTVLAPHRVPCSTCKTSSAARWTRWKPLRPWRRTPRLRHGRHPSPARPQARRCPAPCRHHPLTCRLRRPPRPQRLPPLATAGLLSRVPPPSSSALTACGWVCDTEASRCARACGSREFLPCHLQHPCYGPPYTLQDERSVGKVQYAVCGKTCAPDCSQAMVGDGRPDPACNYAACCYDGADYEGERLGRWDVSPSAVACKTVLLHAYCTPDHAHELTCSSGPA